MSAYFLRFALLIAFLGSFSISAQETDSLTANGDEEEMEMADTFSSPQVIPKKHFWRGAGELFLVELIPWSYNYFVRDADFAHISFQSIGHNLKPSSWEWDDNNFKTNQFAHPYHGNLYFNSFRTNGYSFWESVPAAFTGSFLWEVAGETHNPAPNDFINTSLGGIALGEMTYRLAGLIVNNRKHGFTRQVQEVCATIVNPINSFNRIIDGKWGKLEFTDPEDSLYCSLTLDVGVRRVGFKAGDIFTSDGVNEFYAAAGLRYGNPFLDYRKPFDNFYVFVEVGNSDSSILNTLRVVGTLKGLPLGGGEHSDHIFNISMNYDYYHNTGFEYGAQSIQGNWMAHYRPSRNTDIYTELGASAIVLAATPDRYLYYGEGRNYDYGPGVGYNAALGFDYKNRLFTRVEYRGGWTFTVNGHDSRYWLQAFIAEMRVRIIDNFTIRANFGSLRLEGYYQDFEDTRDKFPYLRLSAGYKINF